MTDVAPPPPPTSMAVRRKFLMMVSYYGRGYVGWQRQAITSKTPPGQPQLVSIQDVVEAAVTSQFRPHEHVNVASVSRTDSGTNALQQYCTFVLPEGHPCTSEMLVALNAALPDSIRAQSLVLLDAVDARRRTKSTRKKYVYYIEQGPRPNPSTLHTAWFIGKPLNLAAMREALGLITGTHDFRAFSQGLQKHEFVDLNTTRTLLDCHVVVRRSVDFSLDVSKAGSGDVVSPDPAPGGTDNFIVCIEITGTGFLRHMVRRIVGTLRPIGEGTRPPSFMLDVLQGRAEPGPSVPSRGLWLHQSWMGRHTNVSPLATTDAADVGDEDDT
ncbi:tRNA pseudouridine(38-40) synthase [Aphanomyces astaci]|uniref:tRNA pseudouridine synthase n=1 Tax=Aphanomyces astaci TaxID=112090 RepID=W4GEX2_APHAT|nr:tRNA pseudouridine(38-40) synthase [Aphanomyces astaci]ETV78220.1 tRNA pseudouridine(38-40) synthase [Aphanomyces astaci]|eukprot:XP_009832557.1 tRNA pseudouridine(38-40) synthase [Aphanomyces astaci]